MIAKFKNQLIKLTYYTEHIKLIIEKITKKLLIVLYSNAKILFMLKTY